MENQEQKTVGLRYGVLAEKLSKQLDEQSLKYNLEDIEYFEKQREAANTLRFANLLPDSTFDKVIQKLHKQIVSHLNKLNK